MTKVSIIMPVYNQACYLDRTLLALTGQTFRDWELIIVDDGSTDRSPERIMHYAASDDRIIVISQENKGVSSARNTGMSQASGEWIWFVDADDLPDGRFLEKVFSTPCDPEIMLIIANYERLENHQAVPVTIPAKGRQEASDLAKLFMQYQYSTGYFGYLWNKLIRRKVLTEKQLQFDEQLSLAEDLKFLVLLYRTGISAEMVPCIATRYTVHPPNVDDDQNIDYFAQLKIQLMIRKWIVGRMHQKQYRPFFNQLISTYAACVIFHGYASGKDCMKLADQLLSMKNVQSALCIRGIEPVLLPVVWCLQHQHLKLMITYLRIRYRIRDRYRRLRR